jgi:hypothetical protein
MGRVAVWVAVLLAAAALPLRAADAPKAATAAGQHVVRYVATLGESADGVNTLYLYFTPADGGAIRKLAIAGNAQQKVVFSDRGDLIRVTLKPGPSGSDVVASAVPFDGPKGLKSPRAYVFEGLGEQKVGVQTHATAKLTRLGQAREALIPNRTALGGKPAPDPVILDRLKAAKVGDVVEVELAPVAGARNTFNLLDVDAYREPVDGDFVKLETVKEGNKAFPGVTLLVDGLPKTYALPGAGPGSPVTPAGAAIQALVKRLRPGYGVRFVARDDPRSTLRHLQVDGQMEPSGGGEFTVVSTYVRVDFNRSSTTTYVYVNPYANRAADQQLEFGVSRVCNSADEANRLKITAVQLQPLRTALANRVVRTDAGVTAQERTQWANAYAAWKGAADEAARVRVEQELLLAAQETSLRWRKDFDARNTIMRSILTAEQLDAVMKIGKPKRSGSSAD